jgi:hypothetical protein
MQWDKVPGRTRKKLCNVIIAVIYTSDAESAPAFLHADVEKLLLN